MYPLFSQEALGASFSFCCSRLSLTQREEVGLDQGASTLLFSQEGRGGGDICMGVRGMESAFVMSSPGEVENRFQVSP